MKITIDDVLEPKSIYEVIGEAVKEATVRGIKANSIVINRGLVFVPGDPMLYPDMICGLKSYITAKELPEDYAFAVLHDPNREPESRWIPVTERLPERFVYVLVMTDFGEAAVARLKGNGRWYIGWDNDQYAGITHWMPLPEPPKL